MTERSKDREEAFDRIVHEYYQAIENGVSVEPKTFIEDHPEFEDQLESFFADLKNFCETPGVAATPGTGGLEQTRMDGGNAHPIRPGSSLTYIGNYRILEEIARGGMGVVFKARQEKLHRTVALKMILSGRLASEAEIDRFQREARAAAALKHPNIVGVHEIGIHQGHHDFTMDYIESVSLSGRLREGSLAPREAAGLSVLLARATHYAHEKGVLHRDLKPANILIDAGGQPHITDFGLAKSLAGACETTVEEITRSGQIVGTPSYMSPEQAAAKHQLVSVSSDVYSLGAILYACLSGRAPFVAESTVETLRQVINDDPLPTRMLNHRVPKDLETICLKCLSKEPHHRYGTPAELAEDLTRFLEGRPVIARPVSAIAKTWRMAKRNPWASVAASLLFGLTVVSPIVAIHQYRQSHVLETQKEDIAGLLIAREKELKRTKIAEAKATQSQQLAEAESQNNRRLLYISDMQRMATFYKDGNLLAMRESLAKYQPHANESDLRDFEWYYWQQKCNAQLRSWSHDAPVERIALSADGQWIASVSRTERGVASVQIRDTKTGQLEKTLSLPASGNVRLRFRNDQQLITISDATRKTAQVVEWRTGDIVPDYPILFPTSTQLPSGRFAISTSTNLIASSFMGRVSCKDTKTGQSIRIRLLNDADVARYRKKRVIYKSGQDHYIDFLGHVSGTMGWRDANIVRRQSNTGAGLPEFWNIGNEFTPPLERDGGPVFALRFSSSETLLAAGSREGRIKIWELYSGEEIHDFLAHQGTLWDIAFSPDDRHLATVGDDGLVNVWELQTGELEARFTGHRGAIRTVDFGRGGYLATGGADQVVRLWHLPSRRPVASFQGHEQQVTCVRFSANGQSLWTSGEDGQVLQWPIAEGESPIQIADRSPFRSVDLSPDGQYAAVSDSKHGVTVWDLRTGGLRFLPGDKSPYPIYHVRVTRDDVLAFRMDGTLYRWDLVSGQRKEQRKYSIKLIDSMPHVAISPDGRKTAVLDTEGQVRIFATTEAEGESVAVGPMLDSLAGVVFSPNGEHLLVNRLAATGGPIGADQISLQLWNADSGELVADVARGPTWHAAFSADGIRLAYVQFEAKRDSGEKRVGDVIVWDRNVEKEVARLPRLDVSNLAISPDGKILAMMIGPATGEILSESRISIRRVSDGVEIHDLDIPSADVAFTRDGSALIVKGKNGRVSFVNMVTGQITNELVNSVGSITSVIYSPGGADVAASFTNSYGQGYTVLSLDGLEIQQQSVIPHGIAGSSKRPMLYLPGGQLTYCGLAWRHCDLDPAVKIRHKINDRTGYFPEALSISAKACFFLAPDRTLFRCGLGDDRQVLHTQQPLPGHNSCSTMVATHDGRLIALAFDDEIQIRDGITLGLIHTLVAHEGVIRALAFSNDGALLASGGADRVVRIWDTSSGAQQTSVLSHSQPITCVSFSPRGTTIVSASYDGDIHLSDVITGIRKTTFDEHEGPVNWVEFSPLGDELASAGDDGTVRRWKAPGAGKSMTRRPEDLIGPR